MNASRSSLQVTPTLLDRLIDQNPGCDQESATEWNNGLIALKESIRRDLENLLNTRLTVAVDYQRFPELKRSILNYGLIDFSQVPLESESDQKQFAARIEQVIELFEPRFSNLSVELFNKDKNQKRMLYLTISATMQLEAQLITVAYQSQVDVLDRHLESLQHG